jgi:cytochrome P450
MKPETHTAQPAHLGEAIGAIFSPTALPDPHVAYARAKAFGEVLPYEGNVFIFGWDAVTALFRHPHSKADRLGELPLEWFGTRLLKPMMLFHDGASHSRLRGLVSQAFTPKAVQETRATITKITDELLEYHAQHGGDFLTHVAVPLPMLVIAKLLGIEYVDRVAFRHWADALIVVLDGNALTADNHVQVAQHIEEMFDYFDTATDLLSINQAPGVLGAMARAESEGQHLSRAELLANAALILAAGFETTTNLMAGAMLEFARFPEQWQKLLQNPDLVGNATEECLRFITPVQVTSRALGANVEWAEQTLAQGSHLNLMLGAANRDPHKFENPEVFDISRSNASQHVSFASGAHYCLGAPLARLEMQVFLERVALKYPNFTVPKQALEYRNNYSIRGLARLEVRL